MKAKIISMMKAGIGCSTAAIAVISLKYCLFAPEQIGQIVKLFN